MNIRESAVKRIKNPLPVPTVCHYCGGEVGIVSCGESRWPWVYMCTLCEARASIYLFTRIPLEPLVDKVTSDARFDLQAQFLDWCARNDISNRRVAYSALAEKLGIGVDECRIWRFDAEMCKKAMEVLR